MIEVLLDSSHLCRPFFFSISTAVSTHLRKFYSGSNILAKLGIKNDVRSFIYMFTF